MNKYEGNVIASISIPIRIIFLMWAVFAVQYTFIVDLGVFGILPRQVYGLIGVVTAPLIHGSPQHLLSNTFPITILRDNLVFFYGKMARAVFFLGYFLTGLLVWLIGRQTAFHIGASGLVYFIASFLVFYGLFKRDIISLLISIVIFIFYNGMIYGVFPNQPGVSWESHLAGGIVGVVIAYMYAQKRQVN